MNREYLVSAEQMQYYDCNTIERIGIPACVLMERAAYAVAMEVRKLFPDKKDIRVLVLSGNGNNGADGVCAGRILKEYGAQVCIHLISNNEVYGKELQRQLNIAAHYGIILQHNIPLSFQEYDVVVDALFGNGLNREVSGLAKEAIEAVNASGLPVVSVDIPSGIDATTGKILGCAIKATVTVTFGFYKRGQMLYPGRLFCGKLIKAKIGIDETAFFNKIPDGFTYLPEELQNRKHFRNPMGNKGTFGKVLVVAGRQATTGAALLCARSALRSGCGMVCVFTEKENKYAVLSSLPEAMVETYVSEEDLDEKLFKWMDWADVIVTGCGLLQDAVAYHMVKQILKKSDKPVVCDADALHLISKNEELKQALSVRKFWKNKEPSVIFTPHPQELATLAGCCIHSVKADRMAVVKRVLDEYPVILVAKDADTLVCMDGEADYVNVTGNDGLSTAGSGDVLAGLIASMVAQVICAKKKDAELREGSAEYSVFEAVCKSVYLHGYAADRLTKENGKSYLTASDLMEAYKYILE